MQSLLDQVLPSFESLGLWGYWVLAFLVLLQGFAPTAAISPASVLVVVAGGLSAQGVYDLGDMIWFVAVADSIGGELSYRLGAGSRFLIGKKVWFFSKDRFENGRVFFDRYGPFGLVIGRFLPLGSFVSMVAGMTGMQRRAFHIWNIAGGLTYALVGLLIGYFFGNALTAVSVGATRLGAFVLALVLVLALIWFLLVKTFRVLPFVVSVLGSAMQAIADNPDVRALAARHPRLFWFLGARFSKNDFLGLPTTVLAASFVYFAVLYMGSVADFILSEPIVQADIRIANLIYAFRDPQLVKFFTLITALGYWKTVTIIALGASGLMVLGGRRYLVPVLWLMLLGNQATVAALKAIFARPRPELAVYLEQSASFPSGHAAISTAFFGFLTYVLMREKQTPPLVTLITGATLIFLVGLSRIYLVEHYLSDVLNGYLVGALWLLAGIWLLEWRRDHGQRSTWQFPGRWARIVVLIAMVAGGIFSVGTYRQSRNEPPVETQTQLSGTLDDAFAGGLLNPYTETLLGKVQQPIILIVLARDEAAFLALIKRAGWKLADKPTLTTMSRAAFAAWFSQPYPTAPITPSFWNGRPHDYGFQAETSAKNLRQRHHARFWNSGFRTENGQMIFLGSASFDDRLKWGLTHHIDPNIDTERELLVTALTGTGLVQPTSRLRPIAPVLGTNMTGDRFFTDGAAVVIDLGE